MPFKLDVVTVNRVTTAVASYAGVEGFGSAIQHEDDEREHQIGVDLAAGRALIDLGKALTRLGHAASNGKLERV